MARLLVVDDDPHILELVTHVLTAAGHQVDTAATGHGALEMAAQVPYELVVLDVMLPGIGGREVCRRLRKGGTVPILMLTALGEVHHKVQGFDAGADDYLAKPFEALELTARVKALLRRAASAPVQTPSPSGDQTIQAGPLSLYPSRLVVETQGRGHILPAKEFALLACMARSPGRLFSRDQLIEAAWGSGYQGADRTIDVYMNRIRTKLPEEEYGYRIVPIRGVGYRLEVQP